MSMPPAAAASPASPALPQAADAALAGVPSSWVVEGMTCASCVGRVEKVARVVPGVVQAEVNLASESLQLRTGPGFDPQALQQALHQAGYELPSQTVQLAIEGMTCASCVGRVEKALRQVPGVVEVSVNLATESATVTLSPRSEVQWLSAAVQKAGYQVQLPQTAAPGARQSGS